MSFSAHSETWTQEQLDFERELADLGDLNIEMRNGTPCRVAKPELLARARMNSIGIPRRLAECTLTNFQTATSTQARMLNVVRSFIDQLGASPRPKTGLLASGPTGIGKTHLAIGLAKELAGRNHSPRFVSYDSLAEDFRQGFNGNGPDFYIGIDVLVLDDLITDKPSQVTIDRVRHILTKRIDEMAPTIITTNLPLHKDGSRGLNGILGDRLVSRIYADYMVCQPVDVVDYRVIEERGKS